MTRRQTLQMMGMATASLAAGCATRAVPASTPDSLTPLAVPEPLAPARLVTRAELAAKDTWVQERILATDAPFSFSYGSTPSAELLPQWRRTVQTEALDPQRTRHTLTWTDPDRALEVRCEAVDYADHPVVEWTVW
ncbi:MAG: hypothetical protein ACRC1H_07545, partial [Caldilineaceae bacterium]